MFTLFYVLIYSLVFSFVFSYYSKKKISESIPFSFIFLILWLYIFSITNNLKIGVYALLFLLIIIFVANSFLKKDFLTKNRVLGFKNLAILIYVVLLTATFFNSRSMRFKDWDEFSHWGPAVKSMYLFDTIGPYSPAQLVFPEAPPGLSLFPYWVAQTSPIWNEALVYWAYQVLAISLIIGVIKFFPVKKIWENLFLLVVIILTTTIFFNTYQTIYADALLALYFGFALYLGTKLNTLKNHWNLISFCAVISLIVLMKDIGVFFAAVAFGLFTIQAIFASNKNLILISKAKSFISFGLVFSTLIMSYLSWQFVLRKQKIIPTRPLSEILTEIFSGNFSSLNKTYSSTVIDNFINKSLVSPVTTINALPMSPLRWILVFAFILSFYSIIQSRKVDKFKWALNSVVITAGFVFYLLVLLFLYLTSFAENEAVNLASYERYVVTYLAGLAFLLVILISNYLISQPMEERKIYLGLVWVGLLMFQSTPSHILSYIANPTAISDGVRGQYAYQSDLINNMGLTQEHKVWIIAQHTFGFEFYFFQYELLPASVGRAPWSIGSNYGPGDIWTDTKITVDVWDEMLNDYDFVLVNNVTESFSKEFGQLFADPSSLSKPGFYEVKHEPSGNLLIKVL